MKAEPLVTRALMDAIDYCQGQAGDYEDDFRRSGNEGSARMLKECRRRLAEYRRLLKSLKPAKSVPKRGRR